MTRRTNEMPMFSTPSDSRRLSPTRSMMPAKSSCAAMPCWIELMAASSVVRCSVSRRRRCVSSNSRAFSSATPMLPATVVSSRASLSPNAYSRSWSSRTIEPDDLAVDDDRHPDERFGSIGSFDDLRNRTPRISAVVPKICGRRDRWRSRNDGVGGAGGDVEADAVLVRRTCSCTRFVDRSNHEDADVVGTQHHTELVAGHVDDLGERLPGGDAAQDGVDDAQHVTEMVVVCSPLATVRPVPHRGAMIVQYHRHWLPVVTARSQRSGHVRSPVGSRR